MSFVRLSRTCQVSAAHQMRSTSLTPEQNSALFGKCANLHGHNYKIKVTVVGPIDERNGMVIDIAILKEIMQKAIMDKLDHRNIDQDVPYFSNRPSTLENLVLFVWSELLKSFREHTVSESLLHEVEIHETDQNSVSYRGTSTS
ncbi:PTPS-domain-containing protein [Dendrothele bispora CBS 962.96]|uniref:6-pyruvoyl tetrahydrobiopterin synthase n=1 Tax=Dendrothele bispora (strain CBS 962.96) TaxID=1314807 RepID=A0A4S8LCH5_DENBC|nr:PTPS-domain-containing protein [Dendrothele bispora CBS 962.96]